MKISFEKQFYIISKFIFIYHYFQIIPHSNGKQRAEFKQEGISMHLSLLEKEKKGAVLCRFTLR